MPVATLMHSELANGRPEKEAPVPKARDGEDRSAAVLATAIQDDILRGFFPPGSALREVGLAERFGVSRRTVREALLILNSDGLVTHRHNQGASVRVFSAEDVKDLYRARRLLELEGARQCSTAPAELLSRVDGAFRALEASAHQGFASIELARADTAFHGAVIGLLESPRLEEFYSSIAHQMVRVITLMQASDASQQRDLGAVVAEHRAINAAIQHRDAWESQRLITEHIDRHQQNLLAGLIA